MNDSKPFWASKSFWGSVVMIASAASVYFKIDLGEQTSLVNAIVGLLGSGISFYGRVKAIKKIELL